mmetsp:Transcript_41946/g.103283  ORF Transcript_41946/g.103283 Transcript_41946/m.103283 type:complete len:256 (-) Transcript_41946:64-831(-)|eukprot:CAMPEP_0197592368 /NCGR_PEP_ID=MMETSP1326-20131121/15055_1 /TAXON_ID=1155430 /ORGANISM="Genus nov. species nov., Strain RCC2288" /LENGTH=255 /DNA_ID=CAMNT_0043158059 /DNA_START=201 /DNA_END=968 /DNA_ORIENTATION=+
MEIQKVIYGAMAVAAGGLAVAAMYAMKLPPPGSEGTNKSSENKTLVRKLYREVWNQADLAKAQKAATKFISEDHILIDPSHPNPTPGFEAYMEGVGSLREALSNYVINVDDLIAQGLKVVAQLSFKASVSGKEARWTGTAIMEIDGGKVVKTWINSDSISALIQLGLLNDVVGSSHFDRQARASVGDPSHGLNFSEEDLLVVQALIGRSEAHPTSVLTGSEWLAYFEKVNVEEDVQMNGNNSLRTDHESGLDLIS